MIIAPVKEGFDSKYNPFGNTWIDQKTKTPFYAKWWLSWHNWVDLKTPIWTEVFASFDWILTTGYEIDGYGKYIYITEEFWAKRRQTVLAHLSEILITHNSKVTQWQLIAKTWDSGCAKWKPHLHWWLRYKDEKWNVINVYNGYGWFVDCFWKWWILQHKISKY